MSDMNINNMPSDPKEVILTVYRLLMENQDEYCERILDGSMNDEYMKQLYLQFLEAEKLLKYHMLEIPYFTYTRLYNYLEKQVRRSLSANWREFLEQDYQEYLLYRTKNEFEDENLTSTGYNKKKFRLKKIFYRPKKNKPPLQDILHKSEDSSAPINRMPYLEEYLLALRYYFAKVMGSCCRNMFNTGVIPESVFERINKLIRGDSKK